MNKQSNSASTTPSGQRGGNRRRWWWIGSSALVGLVALVTVYGTGYAGSKGWGSRSGWVTSFLTNQLDLSEEQSESLESLVGAVMQARGQIGDLRDTQIDRVKALIAGDALTDADFEALTLSAKSDVDAALKPILPHLTKFHATLSPEQRNEIVNLMDNFRNHRFSRRGGHGKWKHHDKRGHGYKKKWKGYDHEHDHDDDSDDRE